MPFAPTDLAALEAAVEIEIETRAAADAPSRRTIVWVVTDGPDAFVRSVDGATANWYRRTVAYPRVVLHVGGRAVPARALPAPDAGSVARTSAALERKYAGDPDLGSMLVPAILPTTLRLEPA